MMSEVRLELRTTMIAIEGNCSQTIGPAIEIKKEYKNDSDKRFKQRWND